MYNPNCEEGFVTFHGIDKGYPENKNIYVEERDSYGSKRIYPICPKGRLFARLVGTKTLTLEVIETIKKLGYTIIEEGKIL